jgi:hypothetical protein
MRLTSSTVAWVVLLTILSTFAHQHPSPTSLDRLSGSANYLTKEELWFQQTLDHFSPYVPLSGLFALNCANLSSMSQFVYKNLIRSLDLQDHRRFQQRYYEFFDYFRVPDGPIFLKICGESSCNGIANDYISVSL